MRLLADENVPLPSIFALRTAGMDVAAATEDAAGASDREVLARAQRENRLSLLSPRSSLLSPRDAGRCSVHYAGHVMRVK